MSGFGRSPGEGKSYPLQYSGLENSMDYSLWGHKDKTEQLSFSQKIQIVKGILRKKNKAGAITLPDFRLSYKANSQKVQYWDKSRHIRKLNSI